MSGGATRSMNSSRSAWIWSSAPSAASTTWTELAEPSHNFAAGSTIGPSQDRRGVDRWQSPPLAYSRWKIEFFHHRQSLPALLSPTTGRCTTRPKPTTKRFGARQARELVSWNRDFDTVLEWELPFAKWFVGGELNVTYNCLDRHVEAGPWRQRWPTTGRASRATRSPSPMPSFSTR